MKQKLEQLRTGSQLLALLKVVTPYVVTLLHTSIIRHLFSPRRKRTSKPTGHRKTLNNLLHTTKFVKRGRPTEIGLECMI